MALQTVVSAPSRTRLGTRGSTARGPVVDHRVEVLAAAAALLAALTTTASPTGTLVFDLLYRLAFAAGIVLAAARARRWTLPILSGVGAVVAAPLLAQVGALLALGLAMGHLDAAHRRRDVGALVAALSIPALLTQGTGPLYRLAGSGAADPTGSSASFAAIAIGPLLWSAWGRLRRGRRASIRLWLRRAGWFCAAGVTIGLASGLAALFPAQTALSATRDAAAAAADGDLQATESSLQEARTGWQSANWRFGGPWMFPARAIPLLGQHVRVVQTGLTQAAALTDAGALLAQSADADSLIVNGGVDMDRLNDLVPLLDATSTTATRAHDRLNSLRSPWLLPPVALRLDEGLTQLESVRDAGVAIATAGRAGSELLAVPGGSTVVVMFSTPAEARGSGGFIGNWAEFRALDGQLKLVEQYRSKQLNDALIAGGAELRSGVEYEARYGRFDVQEHVQDVTLSPDFPTVGQATADLYRQATGQRVDAVLLLDPFALEALLAFSGPVEVDGMLLTGSNAATELLRGQYERFAEDEDERTALLDDLAATVVERLFAEPPDPVAFVQELAPLAREGRIALWLADDDDGATAKDLGLAGAFPDVHDDLLAVVHQNAAQNKIDTFLRRSLDVRTTIDVDAGWVAHEAEITLRNEAPAGNLPMAIIGSNDQGLPLGTNRMLLTVYSPFPMTGPMAGVEPLAVETQREFGVYAHTMLLELGPQSTTTIRFSLSGAAQLQDGYVLDVPSQPLARPDLVSWTLRTIDGGTLDGPQTWTPARGLELTFDSELSSSQRFEFSGR